MKPSEFKEFLKIAFTNNLKVMVVSSPGMGKTEIINQAAQETGHDLMVSYPALDDPTDGKGMPAVTSDEAGRRVAEFLPFGQLRYALEATRPTVWLFDDFGQGTPAVQASYMNLFQSRLINGHKISDHIKFVIATNNRTHRANVNGILEPVKSRQHTIINLEFDLPDWVDWALAKQVPTPVVMFAQWRPALLQKWEASAELTNSPSPRTLFHLSELYSVTPQRMRREVFAGAVGEAMSTEFMAFLSIMDKLDPPDLVLMNPDTARIPENLDGKYAMIGALIERVNEQNVGRFFTYVNRLPAEFNILAGKQAAKANPKEIATSRAYIEWCARNRELI